MKSPTQILEVLESRIAPAGLVTFNDVDGDVIQVSTSKGTSKDLSAALTVQDSQLQKVNFADNAVFQGTTLNITVKTKSATGDGFVNVGLIDAGGIDLGAVIVKGDLGKILAGDNNDKTYGLYSLKTNSIGAKGTSTQAEGGDLHSVVVGPTATVTVTTSVKDATLEWNSANIKKAAKEKPMENSGNAYVTTINIGKDLVGGDGEIGQGSISVDGNIRWLGIGGNLKGGSGDQTGKVSAVSIQNATIGGSILGGKGDGSGALIVEKYANQVSVGGNVMGDDGDNSGRIEINGNVTNTINNLNIGGNLTGGNGDNSGQVDIVGKLQTLKIRGNLIGGAGADSGHILNSDVETTLDTPTVVNNIGTLTIGGSIVAGTGDHSANVKLDNVGTLTVGGNIDGRVKLTPDLEDTDAAHTASVEVGTASSILIGGNIFGGQLEGSGHLAVKTDVKTFKLKGSLNGGDGLDSGKIDLFSATTTASSIGGSVIGGEGEDSGAILLNFGGAHTLAIGGKVQGSTGEGSGSITAWDNIASLKIGGSLLGGSGDVSGSLLLLGRIKMAGENSKNVVVQTLSIGGDVKGGGGDSSGSITTGTVTAFTIGGEILGGEGESSAAIGATAITAFSVGHDIRGGEGEDSARIRYSGGTTFFVGGSIVGGTGLSSAKVETGGLSSATVEGSVLGGEGVQSGALSIGGGLVKKAPVKGKTSSTPLSIVIGGDITGGDGEGSGRVEALFKGDTGLISMTVGGTVQGSTGANTGSIRLFGNVSSLAIEGSIIGGTAENSGSVFLGLPFGNSAVKLVSIGGSIIGGTNSSNSGSVFAEGNRITSFTIGGDVVGGTIRDGDSMPEAEELHDSGAIIANGIDTLTVGGSLIADVKAEESDVLNFGAIRVGTLGTLNVNGSIQGTSDQHFLITAQGNLITKGTSNVAIKAVNVLGDVSYSDILAGYNTSGTTLDGDGADAIGGTAQIGNVHVYGDWHASSLTAGTNTGRGGEWGSESNYLLNKPEGSKLVASITSIVIDGVASAVDDAMNGFVAEKISSLVVGGDTYVIPAAPQAVQVGDSSDLVARLVVANSK